MGWGPRAEAERGDRGGGCTKGCGKTGQVLPPTGDGDRRGKGEEASKAAASVWDAILGLPACLFPGRGLVCTMEPPKGQPPHPPTPLKCSRAGRYSSAPQRSSHKPARGPAPSSGSGRGGCLVTTWETLFPPAVTLWRRGREL